MTIYYKPIYKFTGFKAMNEDNLYVVDVIGWQNGDSQSIIQSATLSNQLESSMGFVNTDVGQFDSNVNTIIPVGTVYTPITGVLTLGIVGGPDYEVFRNAYDPDIIREIINTTAKFKLNIHPLHAARQ